MTHCLEIFIASAQAFRRGLDMIPRSRADKEYFAQDWFLERLDSVNLPYIQQGRNSYPDFWVGDDGRLPIEGYEVKSLAFSRGKPARKDYDSNSTVPSGRLMSREVFLVFCLYTGKGPELRKVHSFYIAHTDLINADHVLSEAHANEAVRGFGSYGDGFIRNRKMYVFPHPFALDPGALERCRLAVPAEWKLDDPRLTRVSVISRSLSAVSIRSYVIDLYRQKNVQTFKTPNSDAGRIKTFDVFELSL